MQNKIGYIVLLVEDTESKIDNPIIVNTGFSLDETELFTDEEKAISIRNEMKTDFPSCTYVVGQVEYTIP